MCPFSCGRAFALFPCFSQTDNAAVMYAAIIGQRARVGDFLGETPVSEEGALALTDILGGILSSEPAAPGI